MHDLKFTQIGILLLLILVIYFMSNNNNSEKFLAGSRSRSKCNISKDKPLTNTQIRYLNSYSCNDDVDNGNQCIKDINCDGNSCNISKCIIPEGQTTGVCGASGLPNKCAGSG